LDFSKTIVDGLFERKVEQRSKENQSSELALKEARDCWVKSRAKTEISIRCGEAGSEWPRREPFLESFATRGSESATTLGVVEEPRQRIRQYGRIVRRHEYAVLAVCYVLEDAIDATRDHRHA
jgi:hypothetical protein